jgi:hypothetical protein
MSGPEIATYIAATATIISALTDLDKWFKERSERAGMHEPQPGFRKPAFRWLPTGVAVLAAAYCCYALQSSPNESAVAGACSMKMDFDSVKTFLEGVRETADRPPRPIRITVQIGRAESCKYANDLEAAFRNAGWADVQPIDEANLIGDGIVVSGRDDPSLMRVVEVLGNSNPVRLHLDDKAGRSWTFWIKDTLPPGLNRLD